MPEFQTQESIGQSLRRGFVTLLSGGLDSTVCTTWAIQKQREILKQAAYRPQNIALVVDYGQRAFQKELTASKAIARHFGMEHKVIQLEWLKELLPASLQSQEEKELALHRAMGHPEQLSSLNVKANDSEASAVWVPNRNGVLLNVAAAYAEFNNLPIVLFGSNREEAEAGFPDNTFRFRENINVALRDSTSNGVRVMALLEHLSKIEILRIGMSMEAPLDLIWSCYRNGPIHCGECASCLFLKRALQTMDKLDKVRFAV
ncbi:MAG: 7-cyano-7-deazaguanine synthase [Vampirovibrionales bacterium]